MSPPHPAVRPAHVTADRDVCIGAGLCVTTAEEVFDQGDDGLVVLRMADPPEAYAERVRQAVRACPSGALSLRPRG